MKQLRFSLDAGGVTQYMSLDLEIFDEIFDNPVYIYVYEHHYKQYIETSSALFVLLSHTIENYITNENRPK